MAEALKRLFFYGFAVMLAIGFSEGTAALAGELPAPKGRVILTLEGNIANTTIGKEALFDRSQLAALGMHELATSNPFEKGIQRYEGFLLKDLLDKVGANGTLLEAIALDGYTVEIPIKDAYDFPVLVAMKWNGKVLRVRNKGPLWIIYPIDQHEELKAQQYSGRSIWQLKHLTIK